MENIKSSADFPRRKHLEKNNFPENCDSFLYDDNVRIHFSCSGTEGDIKLVETVLNDIGQYQYCTGSIQDYRKTITSKDQCVRNGIESCDLVIGIVTSNFAKDNMCLYEIALSIQFQKCIILILFENVKTPDIFANLDVIDATGHLDIWKDLLKKKISSHANDQGSEIRIDTFVSALQTELFPQEVREKRLEEELEKRNQIILEKDEKIRKLEALLEEKQEKQECTEERNKEEQFNDGDPNQQNLAEVVAALCVAATESIPIKKGLLRSRKKNKIKDISKQYSMLFSFAHIRTFGRNLELDEDELDSVEKFRENGSSEMFWQTVRVWMSKTTTESKQRIRTLLKAIEDTGIDLKGRRMSDEDKRLLQSQTTTLTEQIHSVEILMPHFLTHGMVCDNTRHYIEAGKHRDQQILRLTEILETKEQGFSLLIKCLNEGGHEHLARILQDEYDSRKVPRRSTSGRKKVPVVMIQPSRRSSDSPASTISTASSQELDSPLPGSRPQSFSSAEVTRTSCHSDEDDIDKRNTSSPAPLNNETRTFVMHL